MHTDPLLQRLMSSKNLQNTKGLRFIPHILIIDRSSTITPFYVDKRVAVYNGREFKSCGQITLAQVGHKFGEFVFTKVPANYTKKHKK